ncbi:MAG TPA: hypothetical protein VI078_01670 [bacterium]
MIAAAGSAPSPAAAPGHRRRQLVVLAALAALSIAVHAFAAAVCAPEAPFLKYPLAAEQYLRGGLGAERIADFSQLYLALHVAVQMAGLDPLSTFRILHVAFSTGAALLLFLAVRAAASTGVALAATAGFLLNASVLVYTQLLEPEAMLLFLLLAFAFFAVREERRSLVAAGAFLALCVLTRPTYLPLAAAVPLWLRLRAGAGRPWRAQALCFLAPLAVALVPAAALSPARPGSDMPLVMNPGNVFFEGNNPLAGGLGLAYPPLVDDVAGESPEQPDYQHAVYRTIARGVSGRPLDAAEVNAYWSAKALAFLRDEPREAARRLAGKVRAFLGGYRRHDVLAAFLLDRRLGDSALPAVPFAAVSAFAVVGLAVLAPAWRRWLPFHLVWATQLGLAALVYATDRQRVAVAPFFVFFAAAAAAWALQRRRNLALLAAVALPLTALFSLRSDVMREDEHLWSVYAKSGELRGEAAERRERGDRAGAARATAAALAQTPWMADWIRPSGLSFGPEGLAGAALAQAATVSPADFSGQLDRAILLIEAGRPAEAEPLLLGLAAGRRRFARVFDGSSRPEFYLGVVAALRGDRDGAVRRLEETLARSPGDPFALAWLAALTGRDEPRRLLARYFDEADAAFLEGQAHLRLGHPQAAVEAFAAVNRILPGYRRGRIYLAVALGAAGRYEQAAELYLDTVRERPEPVLLEADVRRIFDGLVAAHPASADARRWREFVRCEFEACPR